MPRAEGPAGLPRGGLGAGRGRGEEARGPATVGGSRKELLGRKLWSPSPPLGDVIQEESARALGEAYVVGLPFQGARMLFSACQPCMDMDRGPGGSTSVSPTASLVSDRLCGHCLFAQPLLAGGGKITFI